MPYVLRLRVERDLFWVNLLGLALIVVVGLFPTSFVRIVLGVPFVLFFPGYALVCALFPGNRELDWVERVALSIGLSIAVVPLIGFVLNYSPFGIRLYPLLTSLFLFMLVMSAVAFHRRKKLTLRDRFSPRFSVNFSYWSKLSRTDKVLSVGLITGVVISGALIFHFVPAPKHRFTDFYVLGPGGKVTDYPTNLVLGENATVILGIINHEHEEVNYRIIILFNNETIERIDGITLKHEEKWEQNVTFTAIKVGEIKLEFLLYREGIDEPYRTLHLWLVVEPPE